MSGGHAAAAAGDAAVRASVAQRRRPEDRPCEVQDLRAGSLVLGGGRGRGHS